MQPQLGCMHHGIEGASVLIDIYDQWLPICHSNIKLRYALAIDYSHSLTAVSEYNDIM